jgi:hypothetical protein
MGLMVLLRRGSFRMLHWHELDTKRKRAFGVLVLKHMFTLKELEEDASYLFELKEYVASGAGPP